MFPTGEQHPRWNGGRTIRGKRTQYQFILKPDHPRSHRRYVQEHILIIEKALGKYLPRRCVGHHVDGNTLNNSNNNLVACENNAYHKLLHKRARAHKATGHASWPKCLFCKQYDNPKNLSLMATYAYHKSCNAEHQRQVRRAQ